jgi:S-(hydroxymethyl)glutathione dehydrogenase/alcohol dehydrogenase
MKAAVLHEVGAPLVVEEIDIEPPRAGEVLVRLGASGVCRSDWHLARGVHATPLPVVLGHEGAGIVEAIGQGVTEVRPGDHVVLSWLPYCGRCRFCRDDRPVLCADLAWSEAGTMRDGTTRLRHGGGRVHHSTASTFAEKTVVPAQTAIPIDPSVPAAQAALVGCAVLTGFGAVRNTARVRAGRSVAVIGCGGVGLSIVQAAALAGAAPIVAVDAAPAKRALARDLGATEAVAAGDGEGAVRRALGGGADYVFEAVGEPETIALALRLVGRGGTAVLVGLAPPAARTPIDPLSLVFEERTVTGCLYGSCVPPRDIPAVLDLARAGRLRLDRLVGATCGLEGINDAFERLARGDTARTVVLFPG